MPAGTVFIAGRSRLTPMPIKFRCPNCRQFLGISRAKAGTLTDCPTCGHSIRIPSLDGTVAPLPEPELNFRDAGLAKALDVLAQLDGNDFQSAQAAALAVKPAQPAVTAGVAPVAAPLAAPVVAATPPREISVSERSVPSGPARAPLVEPARPKAIDAALDELNAVVESYPPRYRQTGERPRSARGADIPWWLALLGGILGTGLGFFGGRLSAPAPITSDSGPAVASIPAQPDAPAVGDGVPKERGNGPAPAAVVPGVPEPRAALAGRLTYTNENGESRPDEGARVLVFPESRQGSGKLPVVGFLAGAGDADYRLSKASLRVVGGDYAIADADGRYEISLPTAGVYQVLIVSRYQDQKDPPTLENSLRKVLDGYFDRPNRVIGQVRYHFDSFRFDGAGPTTKGHGFTR